MCEYHLKRSENDSLGHATSEYGALHLLRTDCSPSAIKWFAFLRELAWDAQTPSCVWHLSSQECFVSDSCLWSLDSEVSASKAARVVGWSTRIDSGTLPNDAAWTKVRGNRAVRSAVSFATVRGAHKSVLFSRITSADSSCALYVA